MGNTPLVSVYITNYNYADYIRQSVESVLNQDFEDFELIIVDDGSTDRSREIIDSYRKHRDSYRIKIIYHKNKGLNQSNNVAVKASTGKYVMRLDADDYLAPNALSTMVKVLEEEKSALVFPDYYLVDEKGNTISRVKRHDFKNEVSVYDQPAHGACTMIRRDALIAVGSYSQEFRCQDGFEIWLKIIQRYSVTNINEPLFYYRQHDSNLTQSKEKLLSTRHEIVKKHVVSKEIISKNHVCIVPVRGLEREPLALRKIGGLTLLDRTLNSILKSENTKSLLVSTPDERILEHLGNITDERIKLVFDKRPENLAYLNSPLEQTVDYLLNHYSDTIGVPDTISIANIEFPFRPSMFLDQAINTLFLFEVDSVISVTEDNSNFFQHKGSGLVPVIDSDRSLRLERDTIYREAGGITTMRGTHYLKNRKLKTGRIGHVVVDEKSALEIHSELSFRMLQNLND